MKLIFDHHNYSHEYTHKYTREVKILRELALTDILSLPEQQIKYQLNRIDSLRRRTESVERLYIKEFMGENKKVTLDEIVSSLESSFINLNLDEKLVMANYTEFSYSDFSFDLLSAIRTKWRMLTGFILSIKAFSGLTVDKNVDFIELLPTISPLQHTSYTWADGQEELHQFYDYLLGKFIVKTRLADFVAAFSGQELGTFTPIKWHDTNATEFLFFLKSMMPGLIADERNRMNYQRLIGCFSKPNGSQFNKSTLKSLNQRTETALSQVKQDTIKSTLIMFL